MEVITSAIAEAFVLVFEFIVEKIVKRISRFFRRKKLTKNENVGQ